MGSVVRTVQPIVNPIVLPVEIYMRAIVLLFQSRMQPLMGSLVVIVIRVAVIVSRVPAFVFPLQPIVRDLVFSVQPVVRFIVLLLETIVNVIMPLAQGPMIIGVVVVM